MPKKHSKSEVSQALGNHKRRNFLTDLAETNLSFDELRKKHRVSAILLQNWLTRPDFKKFSDRMLAVREYGQKLNKTVEPPIAESPTPAVAPPTIPPATSPAKRDRELEFSDRPPRDPKALDELVRLHELHDSAD